MNEDHMKTDAPVWQRELSQKLASALIALDQASDQLHSYEQEGATARSSS